MMISEGYCDFFFVHMSHSLVPPSSFSVLGSSVGIQGPLIKALKKKKTSR